MNWFRIIGVLAALWGASVVISFFVRSDSVGSGPYGVGQLTGVVFGGILFLAGLYAAIKGGRKKENS